MSEALRRIVEALEDCGEEEAAAALITLGAQRGRQVIVRETPRTPLPPPGGSAIVHSEVEWI